MRFAVLCLVLLSSVPTVRRTQNVRGVWRQSEVTITGGENPGRHPRDVQPRLMILTQRHYSTMFVRGFEARPKLGEKPTNADLARAFGPFTANSGRYTATDSTITFTRTLAKIRVQ